MRLTKIGKYNVYFTKDVLLLISKFIQSKQKQHEVGGILLGQVKENNISLLTD